MSTIITAIKNIDSNIILSVTSFMVLMGFFTLSVGTLKGDDSKITKWASAKVKHK